MRKVSENRSLIVNIFWENKVFSRQDANYIEGHMNFVCHKPDAELFSYTLSLCLFNLHNCNLNNSFFPAVLADRERSRMNNRRNNHLVLVEVHCCNWYTRKTTDNNPEAFLRIFQTRILDILWCFQNS